MVNAAIAVKLLAEQNDGGADRAHYPKMFRCDDGGHKENAVHTRALGKDLEDAKLFLRAVVGVGEQHMIGRSCKRLGDAGKHACNRLRVDLGYDDAHEVGLAGTELLGRLRRHVARLFDDLADDPAFFLAHIAIVEVSRNGCARNPCQPCDFIDIHAARFGTDRNPLPSIVRVSLCAASYETEKNPARYVYGSENDSTLAHVSGNC